MSQSSDTSGTIGGLRRSRFLGREKPDSQFVLTFVAYNLIRMRNLKEGMLTVRVSRGRFVCQTECWSDDLQHSCAAWKKRRKLFPAQVSRSQYQQFSTACQE